MLVILVPVIIPCVIYEALSRKRGFSSSKSEGTIGISVQVSVISSITFLDVLCDPVILKNILTFSHLRIHLSIIESKWFILLQFT